MNAGWSAYRKGWMDVISLPGGMEMFKHFGSTVLSPDFLLESPGVHPITDLFKS